MNAAIRAVTRCALDQGWEVFGVLQGHAGLIEGKFQPLNARSVGGIIQQGGKMHVSVAFKNQSPRNCSSWQRF